MTSPIIKELFPKPVYIVNNLFLDKLINIESVLKKRALAQGVTRSLTNNVDTTHQTVDDLFNDQELLFLSTTILDHAVTFMQSMNYDKEYLDNSKFHKMWCNFSYNNDFIFPHVHGHCLIAGVFYVKAPLDSYLHFFDNPSSIKWPMKEYNKFTFEDYKFPCIPGSLYLFKNDMLHGNYAQPIGEKIAISFNIGI